MPETPGTNADGTPKLGSWDATPEMVFDHRFSSMQTNTNKVNATLWGTQGGNYLYTSAKGINPNSSDKNNAVYFLVDPNTGQMVKSGNFYGTGGGIADVFGADDTLRAFSGRPTYGASLYGSSVTRDPNMASKVAVQQTTSGGTIGPNTTYTSSGAINNGSTPAVQAPAPQVQGVTQPSQGYQSPTAPLGSAERTQQLLDAAKKQTSTTGQNGTQQPQQAQNALVMPASGSVVDLLNMAGQDSSYAARQQLAKQYGIQGYTGTASQNQELSRKYLEAYNSQKGKAVPQNQAEARGALQSYFDGLDQGLGTPDQQFMDIYAGMNPMEANIFAQMSQLLSTTQNQQSLREIYEQESAAQGIQGINMELADLNRIMDGTEDDIRAEVTAAGGFATESQVQALSGARNKVLLRKANYLTNVLAAKNDYIDNIVSLTKADREQMSRDLDQKLGITKMMFDMQTQMQNAARENYTRIIDTVGWGGLAASVKGNAQQTAKVEKLLGLAPGELEALGNYTKPLTEMEKLQIENAQLQNKKLRMDMSGSGSPNLQFVAATGNQPGGVFNPKTGVFTPLTGTQDNTMRLATAQSNISSIDSLLKNGSLDAAVATNKLGSYSFPNLFTSGKSNFIAGVEQLRTQLTLDNLINAKANGATFGALSEGELALLNASASKLGTWAQKDSAGNVLYYKTDEASFKQELDKINQFAKLDYLLKGGNPASVGVTQQADGTYWVKNSDETYTQLK